LFVCGAAAAGACFSAEALFADWALPLACFARRRGGFTVHFHHRSPQNTFCYRLLITSRSVIDTFPY
jgi:hypothetical protein